MKTHMGSNIKLTKKKKNENDPSVDPTLYKRRISCLLYLTTSHLDICYSVGVNLKESHLAIVKRIICYMNGATYMAFGIPKILM